jgi:hypothetical protein
MQDETLLQAGHSLNLSIFALFGKGRLGTSVGRIMCCAQRNSSLGMKRSPFSKIIVQVRGSILYTDGVAHWLAIEPILKAADGRPFLRVLETAEREGEREWHD